MNRRSFLTAAGVGAATAATTIAAIRRVDAEARTWKATA